jgi:hypothetical protein
MKLSMKLYAAVLGAGVIAISAANAEVRTEVQFAVGTSYEMPAGDFSAGAGTPIRETERRKTAGEKRLREIKAREGSHGDTDATPSHNGNTDAPSSTIQGPSGHSVITGASGGCKTNSTTQYAPSDIHGAVGHAYVVVVTNVDVGVYAKSNCALISRVPLTSLFGKLNIPSTQTLFDPRVLYDPSVDRFLITADSDDSTNTDQYQYFAVSSDETAGRISWYAYSVILSQGQGQGQGATIFCKNDINDLWDYPSAGSSSTRWFITANDFGNVNVTGAILSIDKLASIAAQTTNSAVPVLCLNGLATNLAPPIVTDAGSTAYFLSDGGNGFGNAILSYALTVAPDSPWNDALTEPVSIPVPSWSAAPQAP